MTKSSFLVFAKNESKIYLNVFLTEKIGMSRRIINILKAKSRNMSMPFVGDQQFISFQVQNQKMRSNWVELSQF